ncbi:hypothetical protein NDU88_002898 [Pleurodeles waltl]|uniref:Uncharacterized protein n=1 Tax=Pleurodeles waltl TaxID=8319 RepID=A0AAV7T3Q0_PLEWA|nr:hypothetical protein NDU88_002898 [Pleurodeles waltl]
MGYQGKPTLAECQPCWEEADLGRIVPKRNCDLETKKCGVSHGKEPRKNWMSLGRAECLNVKQKTRRSVLKDPVLQAEFYNSISGTVWDVRWRIQTYHEEQPLRLLLPQRASRREAVTAQVAPPRIGGSPQGTAVAKPPAARGLVQRSCHHAGCSTARIGGQAAEDDVAVTTATNVETLRVAETRATASG